MVNIEKLDSAISELESSSKDILKLTDIIRDTEILLEKSKENSQLVDSLVKGINEAKEKIIQSSVLCEKAHNIIRDYCIKSREENSRFVSMVNSLLLEMKNENTSLYRDFESTITSKFDLFKSDLVVENRKISDDISGRIGEKIDLVKSEIKNDTVQNADITINKVNEKIDSKSRSLTIFVCISILLSIAGIVTNFFI